MVNSVVVAFFGKYGSGYCGTFPCWDLNSLLGHPHRCLGTSTSRKRCLIINRALLKVKWYELHIKGVGSYGKGLTLFRYEGNV
jgi:hypothetical protein